MFFFPCQREDFIINIYVQKVYKENFTSLTTFYEFSLKTVTNKHQVQRPVPGFTSGWWDTQPTSSPFTVSVWTAVIVEFMHPIFTLKQRCEVNQKFINSPAVFCFLDFLLLSMCYRLLQICIPSLRHCSLHGSRALLGAVATINLTWSKR